MIRESPNTEDYKGDLFVYGKIFADSASIIHGLHRDNGRDWMKACLAHWHVFKAYSIPHLSTTGWMWSVLRKIYRHKKDMCLRAKVVFPRFRSGEAKSALFLVHKHSPRLCIL